MPIVIDASVAISWSLRHEVGSAQADNVMVQASKETGIVPGIFWHEVRNVLIVAERKKRIGAGATENHLDRLHALRFVTDNDQDDRQTVALARRHGLSAYDAAYLETAKRRGVELVTLDNKLATAAAAAGCVYQ